MASISFEGFAKTLNKWDVYPGISSVYSGPVRTLVSVAQIVSGVALGLFSCAFGWIGDTSAWANNITTNFKEICNGVGNLARGIVATCPLLGNLVIYLYEKSPLGTTVLRRDADGLYTLPHVDVPGFKYTGTLRSKELKIHAGNFHIDTENGIVPSGWILER